MDPQNTIMQLISNAAAIGGIILGLMLAKSTIEGSLGSKVGGALKRFQGSAQKGAESRYKRSAIGRGEALRKQAKENYRTEKFARKLGRPGFNPTKLAAGGLTNLTSKIPGQAGARKQMSALTRTATAESRKAEEQELKDAAYLVESLGAGKLQENIDSKKTSDAVKAASIARLTQIGSPKEYEKYVNQFGNDTSEKTRMVRHALASGLANNGQQFLKATDLDAIKNGGMNGSTLADTARRNAASGVLSQEKMVSENNGNLDYVRESLKAGPNDAPGLAAEKAKGSAKLQESASGLLSNPQLVGKIKHNGDMIRDIAGSGAPAPAGGGGSSYEETLARSQEIANANASTVGTTPGGGGQPAPSGGGSSPSGGGTRTVEETQARAERAAAEALQAQAESSYSGNIAASAQRDRNQLDIDHSEAIREDDARTAFNPPAGPTTPVSPSTTPIGPNVGPTTPISPSTTPLGPNVGPTTPINPRR